MTALGRYHATKHMVRVNVVIVRVRQASALSQVWSFSGSQDWSHSPPWRELVAVLMGCLLHGC